MFSNNQNATRWISRKEFRLSCSKDFLSFSADISKPFNLLSCGLVFSWYMYGVYRVLVIRCHRSKNLWGHRGESNHPMPAISYLPISPQSMVQLQSKSNLALVQLMVFLTENSAGVKSFFWRWISCFLINHPFTSLDLKKKGPFFLFFFLFFWVLLVGLFQISVLKFSKLQNPLWLPQNGVFKKNFY